MWFVGIEYRDWRKATGDENFLWLNGHLSSLCELGLVSRTDMITAMMAGERDDC